jgi:hypothetical protein
MVLAKNKNSFRTGDIEKCFETSKQNFEIMCKIENYIRQKNVPVYMLDMIHDCGLEKKISNVKKILQKHPFIQYNTITGIVHYCLPRLPDI